MNETELGRVTHIGTWNGWRWIAERIRAVAHRLVIEAEVFVLYMHCVCAERLSAIVDRAATRTIGIGERIALRQEVTLFIDWAERFVAHFMIDQHELTEVRTGPVLNDRLPAARGRRGITSTQWL